MHRRRILTGAASFTALSALSAAKVKQPIDWNSRLALPTYMFKHYTLEQTIEMALRVDIRNICLRSFHLPLEFSDAQLKAAMKQAKEAGLNIYAGGVINTKKNETLHRAFEYAKAAGLPMITVKPMPEQLRLLEEKVKAYNIRAAIHNHGPGDLWSIPTVIYEKIKGLDSRIGICHDTGHTLRAGADPVAETRQTIDRMMDFHLKDVDAPTRAGDSIEFGRGIMDIPAFLRILTQSSYQGYIGIEIEKNMEDLLPGLAESVGYVRGVLQTI